jgi:hypothetical protein
MSTEDAERLRQWHDNAREVLAQHRLERDGWPVDYFTFRLTS